MYLGSEYSELEINDILKKYDLNYETFDNDRLCDEIASALIDKKIIGWFQGRMEFGPRALGHRSILANPLYEDMKKHVNLNIKKREGFRPFAPVVLEEIADQWFANCSQSKYMVFTYTSEKHQKIPSCIHEDQTARVQTLSDTDNLLFHKLLHVFHKKTDCPVLINTSFNVRGEPIVESPIDALRCFFQTGMDVLVLGNCVLLKENNSNVPSELSKQIQYELD